MDELDGKQLTFDDLTRVQTLTTLSPKQRRVAALLSEGCTQSITADRMKVSRSFVSQTVTLLSKHNLVKKQFPGRYNSFYQISPELKAQLKKEGVPEFSNCRTHNIKRKYRILHQTKPLSLDQRAGFLSEWEPRGGKRQKFWFPGKAGEPSVQIDIHIKTIVAYPDKGQSILAASIEEAEDRMNLHIHNTVQKFVEMQSRFGVHMEVDTVGEKVGKTEYAFPMSKHSPLIQQGTRKEGWGLDQSPQDLGNPHQIELETRDKGGATALDMAINKVMQVESLVKEGIREAMPEAMKEFEQAFAPLKGEIGSVMAYVNSGMSMQNQMQQLTFLVAKQLEENHRLRDQLEGKAPAATVVVPIEKITVSAYAPSYED